MNNWVAWEVQNEQGKALAGPYVHREHAERRLVELDEEGSGAVHIELVDL